MRTLLICFLATAGFAAAQDNPFSAFNKRAYGQMKIWLLGSAEKMPEENYNWQPTDSIRKFGQLVGHVADAQYFFCSAVLGEKAPATGIEQSKTSKADLVASLKSAFAYCDKAYDGMTDATATQTVKFFGSDMTKFAVLETNVAHSSEHYGNMVTYLRLKNIVPPSSEQAPPPPSKK
jgi:uncharacterized damage-inducible protein DinB